MEAITFFGNVIQLYYKSRLTEQYVIWYYFKYNLMKIVIKILQNITKPDITRCSRLDFIYSKYVIVYLIVYLLSLIYTLIKHVAVMHTYLDLTKTGGY